MKNNILDYEDDNEDTIYFTKSIKKTKIAWSCFFLLLIIMFWGIYKGVDDGSNIYLTFIVPLLFLPAYLFSLLGFINGVQSYFKKENCNYKRLLLMIGNFLIFGFITIAVIINIISFYYHF